MSGNMSKIKSIDFNKLDQLINKKFEQFLSYDPSQRPVVQAAVVNATFQEEQLLKHIKASGANITDQDLDWLYQNTIANGEGWWSIKESHRIPMLQKFHQEGQLLNLKEKFTVPRIGSDLNQFFANLITGELTLPQIQQFSIPQIQTLVQPVRWL